ncbi:hypothetical protein BBA71_08995 [Acetobacter pasteurianus]|nr:hypothetical protein BBA71_08995 [Acetobacter pasteurianus]
MVKATTVINQVINRVTVDDQTATPVNAIGTRVEGLQDKLDAAAASGESLGNSVAAGMKNAGTATDQAVDAVTAGAGKITNTLGHLGDGVSQISHDVQTGAKNAENALSGVQDTAESTSNSANGISSSFRDNMKEAADASTSLADALSRDATKSDISWQAAAARAGDSISKVQRQIRLLQNEYDRLDARGRAAVANGSTSPEDVTRLLEANKKLRTTPLLVWPSYVWNRLPRLRILTRWPKAAQVLPPLLIKCLPQIWHRPWLCVNCGLNLKKARSRWACIRLGYRKLQQNMPS